ncbi:MAG: DUF2341 domain-containing protein [Planctomycetes bacterium]|nr:DUF2341 domain-containing protein [Planctomycetota bacterium]
MRVFYLTTLILMMALFVSANTWQETTTADFSAGNPNGTDAVSDSVQIASTDNWSGAASNWWNSGWPYRRLITIDNTTGSALADYQVKVSNPVYNETGLVASWHLEGGQSGSIANGTTAGLTDSSGNMNHGAATNANGAGMAWTTGNPDGAVNFDGTDDYVNIPTATNIPTGSSAFTMMAWIKPDVHNSSRAIISWGSGAANQSNCLRLAYGEGGGTYQIKHYFWGNDLLVGVSNLSGAWHHLAVTYDGLNRRLFLDGKQIDSNIPGAVSVTSTAVQIGRSAPAGGEFFDGSIDEVRVYNRPLSSNEINLLYAGNAKLNYTDTRFTKSDGTTEIKASNGGGYWLEKDGTAWVKIPGSLPAGLSSIYMYYGNTAAVSASSGADTFDFFDDFSTDLSRWALTQSTAGNVQILAGEARLTGNSLWNTNGMATTSTISRPAVIEWYSRTSSTVIDTFEGYSVNPLNYNSGLVVKRNSAGASLIRRLDGVDFTNGTHTTAKTLQRITLKPASGYTVYWNNTQMEDNTTWATASDKIAFQILSAATYLYVDDVRTRKYASIEPATSVYAEQENLVFAYRKTISLTNNAGAALSNHQVKIVLNYNSTVAGEIDLEAGANEVQQDFRDVRFGDSSGKVFGCWRESFTAGTKATYWVKVPSIPANGTSFYVYYGSPDAKTVSNLDAVFVKDFSDLDLEGLWHMDEGSGTTVADSSGKGRTATITGTVPWQPTDGGQWSSLSDSKFSSGSHLYLNNVTGNYVNGSYITTIPNTFTMEIWAKPEKAVTIVGEATSGATGTTGQSYAIMAIFEPGANAGAGISVGTNAIQVFEHAGGYLPALLSYPIALSGWNHIAVVYTNKQPKLYLNGALVRTGLTSVRTNVYPCYMFGDGGSGYGPYQGDVDEARIYKRALDANEVKTHYERRKYALAEPSVSASSRIPWNADAGIWPYRKTLTIDNSAGPTQTNFQVQATVNTNALFLLGHLNADCSDLRFSPTNSFNEKDWTANYPYWIESGPNSTTTKIWIKTDSLSASTKTIYMYYGQPAAKNISNGETTFEFFDDFEDNAISPAKWESLNAAGGTLEEITGYLHAYSNANNWKGVRSIPNYGSNYTLEYLLTIAGDMGTQGTAFHGFYDQTAATPAAGVTALAASYKHTGFGEPIDNWNAYAEQSNGTSREETITGILMNSAVRAMVKWYGTGSYYYLYSNPTTYTNTMITYPPSSVNHDIFLGICDVNAAFGGVDLYVYWAGLRKYAATEPAVAVGGLEQIPYKTSGTFTSAAKNTGADDAVINSISWNTSGSGTITMQVRASNATGWTDSSPAWEDVTNGDISVSSSGRYVQYKASLTGTGIAAEPVLLDVSMNYNHAPNAPVNTSPADMEIPGTITPALSSNAFSDSDIADTHASSQWQITATPGDYSSPAYDSGETLTDLTSKTLNIGAINDDGAIYYWHVRYKDNNGVWGNYSTETAFYIPAPIITAAFLYDSDYNNQVDVLQINLSEDILGTASSVTTGLGFTLTENGSFSHTIASGTETSPGTIRFALNEKGTADLTSSFTLSYSSTVGNLADVDGTASKIASLSPITVTTNTLIITNFSADDTDSDGRINTLTFTFNNTITSAGDIADWQVTDADGSTNLLSGLTNSNISFSQNKITVTLPDTAGTNGIPSYQYAPNGSNDIGDTNGFIPCQFSTASDTLSPSKPISLAPSNGSALQSADISFSWTSVTDATGIYYTVEIDDSNSFSLPVYASTDNLSSASTSAVFSNGTYYWHVKATDGKGNTSGWSSAWTFTISLPDTGNNNGDTGNGDTGTGDTENGDTGNPTEMSLSSALVADAGDDVAINPTAVYLDGSQSYDMENPAGTLSYEWTVLSYPAEAVDMQLNNPAIAQPYFTGYIPGNYVMQLIVTSQYYYSNPDTVTITINNIAPFADAGPDRTCVSGPAIILDGSGSCDPNNDGLSYEWKQTSGTTVYLQNAATATASFNSANITGLLDFQLTVTDTAGNSDTDTVYLTINSQNNTVPVASAGVTQIVSAGTPVQLNGTLSSDTNSSSSQSLNSSALSYFWSQLSGPQDVTLSNANSVAPTFVPDKSGVYVFQLIVNDGSSYSAPVSVTIGVNDDSNSLPKASAKILYPSNEPPYAGQQVIISASESADPDKDELSYLWEQTYGKQVLITDTNSEFLIFYPATSGNYKFKLTVNDGTSESIPIEIEVTVIPGKDSIAPSAAISIDPVLDPDGDHRIFSAPTIVTLDGTASAGEGNLEFLWVQTLGPAMIIADSTNSSITFKPQIAGSYGFRLTVTDENGLNASEEIFLIIDTVANGVPTANAGADITGAIGTIVYLSADLSTDPLWDPDGLTTSDALSFTWEQTAGVPVVLHNSTSKKPYFIAYMTGAYEFKVFANDGQSISLPDEITVTVQATAQAANGAGTATNYENYETVSELETAQADSLESLANQNAKSRGCFITRLTK